MPVVEQRPGGSADAPAVRPKVRLLHHMARSGGTLISKCLACMDGILLLSEIHPRGTRWFNPLIQAQRWYQLFTAEQLQAFERQGRIDFADGIARIAERASERGRALVLRDWSHLDFTGVPFIQRPAYRLLLADALGARFDLVQTCTVRHPIDQWLSLSRLEILQGKLFLEPFLLGHRRFAELAVEIGFARYEDFTARPDAVLGDLCRKLELGFDPGYASRWPTFDKITGDVGGSRGGGEIRVVARRPVAPELLLAFARNADYQRSLELLGYDHPEEVAAA
ncbi:MAG: hypothetical protein R3349_07430 [Geminicoccaceae bacterium]|nr:hypothetical protein [Geminicoccaceae bacterium]